MDDQRNPSWSSLSPTDQRIVQDLVAELADPIRTKCLTMAPFELETASQLLSNHHSENDLVAECETWAVDQNLVVRDSNKEPILVYRPNLHSPLVAVDFEGHTRRLLETVSLNPPHGDSRHTGIDYDQLEGVHGPGNFGTLHFACWFEEGKEKDSPLVSRETLGMASIL
jgi:hypothetical protein